MKIRAKNYGCKEEKFVIELSAKYLEILDYLWDNIDKYEDIELTRTAEEMLARWRYAGQFIHPGNSEACEAWQQYLQD